MYEQIIFSGFGGQGIQAMSMVLAQTAMQAGKEVTWMPDYGGAVRGGTSNATVTVADTSIGWPMPTEGDLTIGVVMNNPSMTKFEKYIKPGGLLLANSSLIDVPPTRGDIEIVNIPVNDIATKLGNDKVANMVILGYMLKKKSIVDIEELKNFVREAFAEKPELIEVNLMAIESGTQFSK